MSKVGGALPAWYWPEGVPRRSPVPNQTLDRLIKRASSRKVDGTAIAWPDRQLTYGELLETVTDLGHAVFGLCGDDETVAVAEADAGDAYVLMLAALTAGKRVLLVDPAAAANEISRMLGEVEANAVLTVTAGDLANSVPGIRVVTRDQLAAFDGERAKKLPTAKANQPAVIIPADGELAVHSQYSIAAMAISISAFVSDLKEMALVAPPPLWRWESLAVITAALTNATMVIMRGLDELEGDGAITETGAFAMILRDEADELIKQRGAPRGVKGLSHLFVSTGYFKPRWRRDLEHACGREVLPVWGTAPLGPAVAAHPTWFPLDAHGIPLVNVRVLPVDPGSGEPSVVPWEMLEQAEIGIESPSSMTGFVREAANEKLRSGKVMRTFVSGSVDHVGVVLLHKPPRRAAGVA